MLVENGLSIKSILLGGFLHTLDVWGQIHTFSDSAGVESRLLGVISKLSGVKSILFSNGCFSPTWG